MDCSVVETRPGGRQRRDAVATGSSLERDRCANCGAFVRLGDWHPVAAPVGDERVYAFCSPCCRSSWSTGDSDERP